MKRIVRGVCGLLSAVMLLSTTAMAADYTPVVTSDERVKGFYNVYNGENASLQMELAGRYNSGAMSEEGGSLEIVQFNARNGFAYAVSGLKGTLIAIDLNGGMDGEKVTALGGTEYDVKSMVRSYGDMTSVAISPDGTHLAVAIQAVDYDEQGSVALFTCQANGSLTHLSTVEVGVQPDMVTFTPESSKILTANEGEPRMGYSAAGAVDPKGSVSIIDAETFNVETVGFDNFDGRRDALVKEGIVLKKNTVPSVDLEPEYIACTDDTAYVSCQEANAIAVLDLDNAQFTGIYSVGFEDYSKVAIDIDKKDETYAPKAYESLRGIRMPDGISLYEAGGKTYLLTANEGDSREWDKYLNEDERNFKKGENTSPSGAITADNSGLKGKVIFFDSADYDGLDSSKDYLFGGRSFTVLKVTENGLEEIFDSGSKFESITDEKISANFNCSNDDKTVDDRSGKKGPEPESVTVGTVGGKLIEQIRNQYEELKEHSRLKLNVVGIASSHNAIYNRNGIDLDHYAEVLRKSEPSNPQKLCENILGMNIFNSVFVDCTASKDISALYQTLLDNNVSVVAANKIAVSSKYEDYMRLKETALTRGVKFRYETNVGAGLPIIGTINDLRNSGDRILKIEAVLSGTLNFIFNELSADVPFSETVHRAKEGGYSEPDPRIDLSGVDVIRKLVILTREAGYRIEQEDVEKHLFIPDNYFQGSVDDFWQRLPELDADFERRRQQLEKEGKRWRFVATMEGGKAKVSLQEIDRNHPFYNLGGTSNIVLLTTERYREYPMLIQGYGAGASVTAAGVFANVMSIANI